MNARLAMLLAPWKPSRLYRGVIGAWYEPWDLSSMWQESTGVTPAAVNSPVGLILDKSGNGYHASQTTDADRPTLKLSASGRYYLDFDGTSDFLITAEVFPHDADMSAVVAFQHSAEASYPKGVMSVRGGTGFTEGMVLSIKTGNEIIIRAYAQETFASSLVLANGTAGVIAATKHQASATRTIRVSASQELSNATAFGVAPAATSNQALRIGQNTTATQFAPMFFYGGGMVQKVLTDTEQRKAMRYLATRAGVTI